jgi:surface polysaccharide O-acyltransferase-like enzyme
MKLSQKISIFAIVWAVGALLFWVLLVPSDGSSMMTMGHILTTLTWVIIGASLIQGRRERLAEEKQD